MNYLLKTGTLILAVLACACSEKKAESKPEAEKETAIEAQSDTVTKPISITNDVTKSSDSQRFRTTAAIYDAPALLLGENYTSAEQLKKATKLAELSNITHSAQFAKIDEQSCVLATEMILGENLKVADVGVEVSLNDMQMKFFTTQRLGSQGFYELSQSGESNRMYVVVISVEKVESDSAK